MNSDTKEEYQKGYDQGWHDALNQVATLPTYRYPGEIDYMSFSDDMIRKSDVTHLLWLYFTRLNS